ncbi:MAG TPA: urease accessory UreF family protein [Acidimicrobiales bacterium]|nr:urease accessory UreF family protein [Acidimicrobiales bacterium]
MVVNGSGTGATAGLLVLADGRMPTGGHAHSGGVEEAVAAGRVRDLGTLRQYVTGRLATAGEVDAAFAVAGRRWMAAGADRTSGGRLDDELAARIPSAALRKAVRTQGKGLCRAARRCWPCAPLDVVAGLHPDGPLWPVALGAAAVAAGVDDAGAALVARWTAVTGPAWAAVRLLGLDPMAVAAMVADLTARLDARPFDDRDIGSLTALGGPLHEIGAELHAAWEVRLFAS